jgi:hypothetical protein
MSKSRMNTDPNVLSAIPTHCVICGEVLSNERTKTKSITCSAEHAKIRKARLRVKNHEAKCVMCACPISLARALQSAITCCFEHGVLRKASIRSRVDMRRCRFCRKPATPIERAAFKRFRSIELTRPDLLYPSTFKRWQLSGGDLQGFCMALEQSFRANEEKGEPGEFVLELIDRRSAAAPGGAKSGRKKIVCECGHTRKEHKPAGKKNKRQPCRHCEDCIQFRVKGDHYAAEEQGGGGVSSHSQVGSAGTQGAEMQDHPHS